MSNLLAALGRAQLAGLDRRLRARSRIRERYAAAFAEVDGIELMPEADYGRPNRWLTCITIDQESFGASRDDVIAHLETLDIEARPVWKPMHLQPLYREAGRIGGAAAEAIFARGLCLPSGSSGSNLTPEERIQVAGAVRTVAGSDSSLVQRLATSDEQVFPVSPRPYAPRTMSDVGRCFASRPLSRFG